MSLRAAPTNFDPSDNQVDTFLEQVYFEFGYDFRRYARASLLRRLKDSLSFFRCHNFDQLLSLWKSDPELFQIFLSRFTVTVSEFFRDPQVFKCLQKKVFPYLQTYSQIKVWVAGCASGEEAYSMAIMLHEVGLLDNSSIYATDINPAALERASKGVYSIEVLQKGSRNYFLAGGKHSLTEYFNSNYAAAIIDLNISKKIVFATHNLVTDHVFAEVQLILCRNVMIYFNSRLQDRVMGIFSDSLCSGGFLCLGSKESLSFSQHAKSFEAVSHQMKIYRKVRP